MKLFYELDQKSYLVKKNVVLKKILFTLDSKYSAKDIQEYINKLISWYNVKFSDHYLDLLQSENKKIDSSILNIMNMEALEKSYTSFEDELFQESSSTNEKIVLQKHLVVAAGWGLIYCKKSTPEYGYYRACQLLNDFNAMFGWSLSPTIYKNVLDMNYSLDNKEVVELLMKKKREKSIEENKSRLSRMKIYIKKRTLLKRES